MTRTGAAARPPIDERTESFFDWLQLHVREVAIGVAAVAVLGAGAALYRRSQIMKADRAEQALTVAQRSVDVGNAPLAESELKKLVRRYDGTPAATTGAMVLAQLLYDQGKYADGLKVLEGLKRDSKSPASPSVTALVAAGYEQEGKFAEAASRYAAAADAATLPAEKAGYQASAARAYARAGKADQAKVLWERVLTAEPSGPWAGEARVRLGELEALPAARS